MIETYQEFFKNGSLMFKMHFRAGSEENILCSPKEDLSLIYNYTTFEIFCYEYLLSSYSMFTMQISQIDPGFSKQQDFLYQTSVFDAKQIAMVNWSGINSLKLALKDYTCGSMNLLKASYKELEKPKKKVYNCRACNEVNIFGGADNIVDDGKYTCFSCARSLSRRHIGLNEDQVVELLKINRLI